jgi:hypothetical protein
MEAPGHCSPSRNVVSNMTILLLINFPRSGGASGAALPLLKKQKPHRRSGSGVFEKFFF